MNRRALLASLACALVVPRALGAPEKIYRLGALFIGPCPTAESFRQWDVLKQLTERGYVDGRNMVIERRCAGLDFSQAPQMAAELVRLRLDVLVTFGTAATRALHQATKTIPIVTSVADPVGSGFAKTLSRPGGNVTGCALSHPDTPALQIDLIRRLVPKVEGIVLFGDVDNPASRELLRRFELAARKAGLETTVRLINLSGFEHAFAEMKRAGTQAAFILFAGIPDSRLAEVAELATRHRVPAMYYGGGAGSLRGDTGGASSYVERGGLASFRMYHSNFHRRIASTIEKVLSGLNPAEIPWELPDRSFFAINLRTARALGLAVPSDLLTRANQVVE